MNRLYRVGGMILLFLLMANGLLAHGACAVVIGPASGKGIFVEPTSIDTDFWSPASAGPGSESPKRASYSKYTTLPTAIHPDLQRALARADEDQSLRAIAYLEHEVGGEGVGARGSSGVEARSELISKLKTVANRAQAPLRSYLEEEQAAGRVMTYESLWVANAIVVDARPAVIRALATRPSVVTVTLDHWRQWVSSETSDSAPGVPGVNPTVDQAPLGAQSAGSVEWHVSQIRADEVWHALQISGTGAVVAGIDTGVDWLHPALRTTYRSYNPHGTIDHRHSWFDATEGGALYPVDGHGHGTHTLGTMVGGDGVGVAPGARWIAVKVLNNQGYGYDSWIHAGFQWLLAPGGDPSQTPDVVNCSWGNKNGYLTTFQDDLRALRAAGILVVCANGNYGPGKGTVGSPASLPEAFAVGAVDAYDEVASFSARGPSPWAEIRPHVVAPGVHIRSTTPGGAYASMQGTSMAAPQVSGVAAMLRSVSPTLSITRTTYLITSTAVALGEQVPNNETGWGRVDAFAAVAALSQPGFITGTVRGAPDPGSGSSKPIAGATVAAAPHGGGGGGMERTDADGSYRLALAPGTYDLMVSAFGYRSTTAWGVPAVAGSTTRRDFALAQRPSGRLHVRITDGISQRPITATIAVLDTPYEVTAQTKVLDLPAGRYTVRARRLGYRVVTATAAITVGETTSVNLALPDAPSILLVDSGGWYYESQIAYFRQALEDLSYAYDEWAIRDVWSDVPSAADVRGYDVLVWSAPRDAPGYIGAGDAVTQYLDHGGRLLLSGQDVGFWDGGGSGHTWSPYYENYLRVGFVDDEAPTRVLIGEGRGIFSGQTITIAGPGGADNQGYPDVIAIIDSDVGAPALRYESDGCGGAEVGTCLDYRVVYLSFGFEAINTRTARREVMKRSLDWLVTPPPSVGLEMKPQSQLGIGPPGSRVTHTVGLRHVGQSGEADGVRLTLQGASWHTEISDSSLRLSPCESTMITLSVSIPTTATWDLRDVVTLTARSSLSPTVMARATFETKTPAPVLLVDDDRWYDQQTTYKEAMDGAGLRYDVWETSKAGGGHVSGPTAQTLQRYPVVVWWTGYDWYAPVSRDEEAALGAYLDGGGRLMLSSQDYLYYHYDEPFAHRHLGVLTYTEAITPTHLEGVAENPVGADLGPWALEYPPGYQKWSDGVVPAQGVGVAFRDQSQRGTVLTRRADKEATLFFALPFEALPAEERVEAMERGVGWLSWLGRSTFEVEPKSARPGDTVTYTVSLKNDGLNVVTASLSNTLPAQLIAEREAFAGPGTYGSGENRLSWQGAVRPDQSITFTYRAVVSTDTMPGDVIFNTARVLLEDHSIAFTRRARVRVLTPDLSRSTFDCEPSIVQPGRSSTCMLTLRNTGPADADVATAHIYPPGGFRPDEDSLWTSSGLIEPVGDALTWSGPLTAGGTATLTFEVQMPSDPVETTLYGVAFLDDGAGSSWERPDWLTIRPWLVYLPVISRFD